MEQSQSLYLISTVGGLRNGVSQIAVNDMECRQCRPPLQALSVGGAGNRSEEPGRTAGKSVTNHTSKLTSVRDAWPHSLEGGGAARLPPR